MLMLILVTVAAAFLFYYLIVKPYDYWKNKGIHQGNPVWIFGDSLGTVLRKQCLAELVQSVYNRSPGTRYCGMYQFFQPILVMRDPDLIRQVGVKDFDHFTDHMQFTPDDPLWDTNLLNLKGEKWREMRATLTPSFTSNKMKGMFVLMSECAENFVQYFLKKNEDVITVEFKDAFTRFTNDVIATTAFGIKVDSLEHPNNRFFLMGKDATNFGGFWRNLKFFGFFLFPKIYALLRVPMFTKEVRTFFNEIINDTIKMREEKGIVRPDMINLLLEARRDVQKQHENGVSGKPAKLVKQITDVDIVAQAMIFFFAGFDSVAALICFLAYELTVNPDIQDRLREEVRSTLKESGGELTYEGLVKMKYLDMVVSETQRKWPTMIVSDRICTKPYTIQPTRPGEKPLHLEKGSVIWIPMFGVQQDPEHFPDPERFDPERFSDENKGNIKPYTYFPFGLGPRNCIGSRYALLEAKIAIVHILQHFEFVPVKKSVIPLKVAKDGIGLSSEDGFWYGLKRISA